MEDKEPGNIVVHNEQPPAYYGEATSTTALILDGSSMDKLVTMSQLMAASKVTIPVHLRGNPGDCLAVVMQAVQWNMNPFAVAQKTHLTQNGQLGYEAQLINAVVVNSKALTDQPDFEFFGKWEKILGKVKEMKSDKGGKYYVADWDKKDEDGLGVIVRGTLRGEAQPREMSILLAQCYPRFSTQWATDPQQQITYAAIRKFARRFAPGAILGVYTPEELDDAPVEREINARPASGEQVAQQAAKQDSNTVDVLTDEQVAHRKELIEGFDLAADQGAAVFVKEWKRVGKANKDDCYLVGADEYNRLLKKSQDVDKAAATQSAGQ